MLSVNDLFCQTMGYSHDELEGNKQTMLLTAEYANSDAYRELWDALRRGESRAGDFKRITKSGEEVWIHASYNPIKNASGEVVSVFNLTTDITEQKQAAVLKSALNDVASAITVADNQRKIVYANNAAVEMLRNRQEILERVVPNFKLDNVIGTCIDDFHKVPSYQQGLLEGLSKDNPHKNPALKIDELSFRVAVSPMYDETGDRTGTVVEWKDVTDELAEEQRQLHEAEQNRRIREALDSASSSLMVADQNNEIIYINHSLTQLFKDRVNELRSVIPGFDPENIVGKGMDAFHRNPSHQQGILQGNQASQKFDAKFSGLTFELTVSPITSPDGKRLGSCIEWLDRTEALAVREEVQEVCSRMAAGDLSRKIEGDYDGFYGALKDGINGTVDKLVDVVQRIKRVSDSVAAGSEEIFQGNTNLSQRTEEQASSLEETSSSMEEMTSTVQQNAENSREADQLAQGAKQKAEHGGQVVGKAVTAMSEINEASNRIADIISVIDEIAFQTNLLALNASVEAARAGEQGRGFAVVASEVRNLAGRSATAAKEIKELIEDSVTKVEQGSKLVDESGNTLQEIIDSVQHVTRIVGDISAASVEQAAGIEEVNRAISMMDEMTQQNAALVEQAAAASEAMGDQAEELKKHISFFRLSGEAVSAPLMSTSTASFASSSASSSAASAPAATAREDLAALSGDAPTEQLAKPVLSNKASAEELSAGEWEEF
jgi:methyl-accepting chemotaxis protein